MIWKKLDEKIVYKGFRTILKRKYELPHGHVADFDIIKSPDIVGILALTPDNKVIIVQQFRPGTEEIVDEIPAGMIDEGESPEVAAERELLEETGYKGKLTFLTSCLNSAYATSKWYCFVATDCRKVQEPTPEETESIKVFLKSLDDFKMQLRDGKLTSVETAFYGLDHLKLL